jgi:hypothetical protein
MYIDKIPMLDIQTQNNITKQGIYTKLRSWYVLNKQVKQKLLDSDKVKIKLLDSKKEVKQNTVDSDKKVKQTLVDSEKVNKTLLDSKEESTLNKWAIAAKETAEKMAREKAAKDAEKAAKEARTKGLKPEQTNIDFAE